MEESRKWGIYFVINLLFKTYFKLNSASLSRTILKTLAVYNDKNDMPPLESFPKTQRVTFKYYEGVLFFLEENYVEVCRNESRSAVLPCVDELPRQKSISSRRGTSATRMPKQTWSTCLGLPAVWYQLTQNRRILTYLIPCRLLTSHLLPTKKLLEPFPRLQELFLPLSQCIRRGDLGNFDVEMQKGEHVFVKRRIYLTLERGRDIALRNLLRKVFIAGGREEVKEGDAAPVRRTRVPVAEFHAAICMVSGGEVIDTAEAECLLANMIYKVSQRVTRQLRQNTEQASPRRPTRRLAPCAYESLTSMVSRTS